MAASVKTAFFWLLRHGFHHQDDALMMKAEKTSETSVKVYQAMQHNNLEHNHLHTPDPSSRLS
jgi:hypothetical protein